MGCFETLQASALSFVVSGNTGISPFLTLFITGLIELSDPTLLNMDGRIEMLLSSWWGLTLFGILTVLEMIGKCVPVVDEMIDSAMVAVVPILSALGSFSTFGLLHMTEGGGNEGGGGGKGGDRILQETSGWLVFLQVILVICGMGLALMIHFTKMIIRLLGEGCLTNIIAVGEMTWIGFSMMLAIFIKPISIFIAAFLLAVGISCFKRKFIDKKTDESIRGDRSLIKLEGENDEPDGDYVRVEYPNDKSEVELPDAVASAAAKV